MRTHNTTTYYIEYPDELTFAFKPIIIHASVSGLGVSIDSMDVAITHQQGMVITAYDAKYYAIGKSSGTGTGMTYDVYADISSYIQQLFAVRQQYIDTISVELTINGITTETFTFTINSVWGAEDYGGNDSFFAMRDVRWWPAFPFTIGCYIATNGIAYLTDGTTQNLSPGITEIAPNSASADTITAYTIEGGIIQSTFDMTFDVTFQGAGGAVLGVAKLHVCDCDKGVYLRWINRHGFYAYWLFKEGASSRVISVEKDFQRTDYALYDDSFGFRDGSGTRQAMQRGDTLNACATLVNKQTFDYLQDLTTSPLVDMYMGQDENDDPIWMSVSIQNGTWVHQADTELQDFEISIIKPFTPIQRL